MQVLLLHEARISLYLSDEADSKGAAVFAGADANSLRLTPVLEKVLVPVSGSPVRKVRHVEVSHEIEIGRTWVRQSSDDAEPSVSANVRYIMVITWTSRTDADAQTYTRTYYGVTWNGGPLESQGVNQFTNPQSFRAERMG
jgi:hypothetical protein